jgi:hypothetical protein
MDAPRVYTSPNQRFQFVVNNFWLMLRPIMLLRLIDGSPADPVVLTRSKFFPLAEPLRFRLFPLNDMLRPGMRGRAAGLAAVGACELPPKIPERTLVLVPSLPNFRLNSSQLSDSALLNMVTCLVGYQ